MRAVCLFRCNAAPRCLCTALRQSDAARGVILSFCLLIFAIRFRFFLRRFARAAAATRHAAFFVDCFRFRRRFVCQRRRFSMPRYVSMMPIDDYADLFSSIFADATTISP